eukprot:1178807-Amorphochlora_amoeboformis.AAC.2
MADLRRTMHQVARSSELHRSKCCAEGRQGEKGIVVNKAVYLRMDGELRFHLGFAVDEKGCVPSFHLLQLTE